MSLLAARMVFTVLDNKGKSSKTEIKIPISTPITAAIAVAQQAATLIAALTKGRITSAKVCFGLNLATSAAAADADAQEKMMLTFRDANNLYGKMSIPTLDETKVISGSDRIDVFDADVVALINLLVTGDGTIAPVVVRGGSIDEVTQAREVFRTTKAL